MHVNVVECPYCSKKVRLDPRYRYDPYYVEPKYDEEGLPTGQYCGLCGGYVPHPNFIDGEPVCSHCGSKTL